MDPLVIAGIISAVAGLIGTGVNAYNQYKQRKQQDNLTSIQMQREDSSIQRQVADLKAAGLSPLMASGGSQTGNYIASPSPTFDFSGFQNALSDMANRKQNQNQFDKNYRLQLAQVSADLKTKLLQNEQIREQIKAQRIANKYNEEHGLRDPSWQQALVEIAQEYANKNGIDLTDPITENIEKAKNKVIDNFNNALQHTVPEPIREGVKEYVSNTVETLKNPKQALQNDINTVSNGLSKAKNYVSDKYNKAKSYVSDKYNKAKKYVYKKVLKYSHN